MTRGSSDLEARGFERVGLIPVALPHFVWKVDLDVELDREVRLVEETVLGLVAQGVGSPDRIAELMGLDDGPILTTAVVELLRRGLVGHRDGSLTISLAGLEILRTSTSREVRRREDEELRHDPYRDELRWALPEPEMKQEAVELEGMHALPAPSALSPTRLESRHAELQGLVEREGFPWDAPSERAFAEKRRREIVRISALKCYVAYRESTLEVWRNLERAEWQWRLVGAGAEDPDVTTQMAALEQEGNDIIPLRSLAELALGPKGLELQATADALESFAPTAVQDPLQQRQAQYEAILGAERRLTIVAPWFPDGPVDADLVGSIRLALEKNEELHATIAYCRTAKPSQVPRVIRRQQEDTINNLKTLAARNRRLRLVEIGSTLESMIIADDAHAVLLRGQLVPFEPKPEKGLLRKILYSIDDAAAVTAARVRIGGLLD